VLGPREVTEASVGKATAPFWRLLILGIAAGAFIAFGAVTASTAAHGLANVGVRRLVSGLIFPVGLSMVVLLGAELFTGNVLMINAVFQKRVSWGGLVRNWGIVYVGNFVGAVVVAAAMAFFGHMDIGAGAVAVYSAQVAAAKVSLSWINAFVLGIFCNVLVCIAIYIGLTARDTAGKILGLFLPIIAFVTSGFEHSIANIYYVPAGIFATMNPSYAQLLADAGVATEVLSFTTFNTANLIPVTLGNILGGLLVAFLMYFGHGASRPRKREVGQEV
jgi:formate/nitrite transporter